MSPRTQPMTAPSRPDALPEPAPELVAHFNDPALRRRLMGNRRWHEVPERKIEDIVHTTLCDAWARRHTWPATIEELDKLLFISLRGDRIDDLRKEGRAPLLRKKRTGQQADEGGSPPDADAEDSPAMAVTTPVADAREDLRWASRYVESRPGLRRAFVWMIEMHMGMKAAEIGARDGSSANTVTLAVSRLRAQLGAAYRALIVLFAVGVVTWAYFWRRGVDDTARPGPRPVPTVVAPEGPAPTTQAPPAPSAEDLRARALAECAAKKWSACLEDLDRAQDLDPDGERAPRVKAARTAIGRALSAKPVP